MNCQAYFNTLPAFLEIKQKIKKQELHHAFLVQSEDELLLEGFYKEFATLLCGKPEMIEANSHPDVFVFPREERRQVLVADTEMFIDYLLLAPAESQNKVFVFKYSETMSAAVQNKLLKTLEEPPRNVYILLLARQNSFLPTVASRVFKINLPHPSKQVFLEMLHGYDKIAAQKAYELFDGSFALSEKYLTDVSFKQNFESVLNCLENMQKSSEVISFSRAFASKRESALQTLELFEVVFFQLVKIGGQSAYQKVSKHYSQTTAAFVLNALAEARKKIKFNCNLNAVFDCLLLKLLEVKYTCQN